MVPAFEPVTRQSLSDDLAQRIRKLITAEGYGPGDRLPSINSMAKRFGVGHPTMREALRRLEVVGAVDMRHGAGVFVGRNPNTLLMTNPVHGEEVTRKLLLDLIEARIPVELQSVSLAALYADGTHLAEMHRLLAHAGEHLEDDVVLSETNMKFHQQVAKASGNTVIRQILDVLSSLFENEQRVILDIYGSRQKDHREHEGILAALEARDSVTAVERMRAHLEGVRNVLLNWDPQVTPLR
jgi:GntR family transcriptional repressor for pyruvate dehydrogenase complex